MSNGRTGRWFQLSLKSLFLLTLAVAIFFAGYSLAVKQAEDAIQVERAARARAEETARQSELARQAERRLRIRAGFHSGVDSDMHTAR